MSDEPKPNDAAPVVTVPRLLVVAVGLFLGPGAGHFAIGKRKRGVAVAAGYLALLVSANAAFSLSPSVWTLLALGLPRALHLASLVDLVRIPKSELVQGKLSNVAFAIVLAALLTRGTDHYLVERHLVQSYASVATSMEPTLRSNDHVLLSKQKGAPKLGAIVIAPDASKPELQGVAERVVGIAGDHVEIRAGELWRNGEVVPVCVLGKVGDSELAVEHLGEPHLIWRNTDGTLSGDWTVNDGEVLLLGDNRTVAPAGTHGSLAPKASLIGEAAFFVLRNDAFTLQEARRMQLPKDAESLRDKVQPCLVELGYEP